MKDGGICYMSETLKATEGYESFSTQRTHTIGAEGLSGSMEDYLEMIYRIAASGRAVRVKELSSSLGVSASSASKMTVALRERGLVNFEKYGYITLTEDGRLAGEYLLHRHNVVNSFLCALNSTKSELSETEKIEHYLRRDTVENMERWLLEKGKNF